MSGEGWRCPMCGSVYAPWVPKCYGCPGVSVGANTDGINLVGDCDHLWITDSGPTRCMKCGRVALTEAP